MRILTVTQLFPNERQPTLGVFIKNRLEALRAIGHEVRVIAPVRWSPHWVAPRRFRSLARVPRSESISGFEVAHPRFPAIPMNLRSHALAYATGCRKVFRDLVQSFDPEIVDGHYVFPDGCGIVRLAQEVHLPCVLTARGSDVKFFGRLPVLGRQIAAALAKADEVHAVSQDLARSLTDLGLARHAVVIRNGVDRSRFRPADKLSERRGLGFPADVSLVTCVAHLVPEHGHALLLKAVAHAAWPANTHLAVIGDGYERKRLQKLSARLDIDDRVTFVGEVPHGAVANWLVSSDLCVLLSEREGCPNIVLEAAACGVASLLSDLPEMLEVLSLGCPGEVVERQPLSIALAVGRMLEARVEQKTTFERTWKHVAEEVTRQFEGVLGSSRRRRALGLGPLLEAPS